ncbi:hypothetical protein DVH24_018722 [Malus domestica]|uniref:Uncharacterized protein n=1 Tax=Malus domestica TaxID=3750 RepID=A0A498HPM9_MALDO|nr:hypothetical protein DVH24_018722 [Malus domestica]
MQKTDSSTFTFWSRSSVDIEPRRIRLQSNSYTANTFWIHDVLFLPLVTQCKEMGGRIRPTESVRPSEQSTERKKGLTNWMNIIKQGNVEKDHWVLIRQLQNARHVGQILGFYRSQGGKIDLQKN